ncbi:Chromosome segregation ATPase [Alteromonas macleodii str. 'Black Sea 11']|nr:Chromosome segregation ATPase [Alteromonas macleodii str. 'Black Sea 11']NKX05544.1 DUF4041 domain-containing protein [Alteromonadaceae bacterium A_SAG6]NKX18952.1 DUF4041 domain-containing protein [Alteromonadaceae bacterium A_SAG5]NKX36238.1 DUF4041 domain-containing protein [Alteromonadaceae bacterium A_SAG3]NKX70037.1 DUF4041 domain-containing protein [Alteromonadaceae bacterium A_SAG7]
MGSIEALPSDYGHIITYALIFAVISLLVFSLLKSRELKSELNKVKSHLQDSKQRTTELLDKYQPISSIETRVKELNAESEVITSNIQALRASYATKRKLFDELERELAVFDEKIELSTLGYYEPHFDFGTSDRFKAEITAVRERQKDMLKAKQAAVCHTEWKVNNSAREGQTMTNRALKLTLRAFNNECDAAVSNVRWNNIRRMEERLTKARDAIDKLNKSNNIQIAESYFQLKLQELRLTFEYAEKLKQEKEDRAEARRQLREEQQLIKEQEAAEREQHKYEELVSKANERANKATGEELERLKSELEELEAQLNEARAKSERALSMAQQTKSGYVYIISNIGSFGDGVFKIGMTRRLEPLDRVRELGDASVPFTFDVHALIYSEDAPALEAELHRHFNEHRLNLVNNRKEFFRVDLDELKVKLEELKPDVEFLTDAEAQDYHQSLLISKEAQTYHESRVERLPDEI